MTKKYVVAVVGVTGAVGQTILRTLEKRNFPVAKLVPMASKHSVGKMVSFGEERHKVIEATPESFEGVDIALFSAGGSVSAALAPEAVKRGAIVIDNTSHFRMDENVPLVVPEVNPEAIKGHQGIIANPNCSTIQLVVALNDIKKVYGIKRIVVSTYQAVSGTGNNAIDELHKQARASLDKREIEKNVYPHPIAFNVIPQIDVFEPNGFTKEEMKMINETKKIYQDDTVQVNATCVRVPVVRGHSESVYIETHRPFSVADIMQVLTNTTGVVLVDDPGSSVYPMPLDATGMDPVYVGRVRQDTDIANGLSMWVVADNLLKGAALNAVQIAELITQK